MDQVFIKDHLRRGTLPQFFSLGHPSPRELDIQHLIQVPELVHSKGVQVFVEKSSSRVKRGRMQGVLELQREQSGEDLSKQPMLNWSEDVLSKVKLVNIFSLQFINKHRFNILEIRQLKNVVQVSRHEAFTFRNSHHLL